MVHTLLLERDQEKQRAEEHKLRNEQLQVELLRTQLELERYKKWYYGPRADRLQSDNDVAQMLLNFAEDLDRKPIQADDLLDASGPTEELRRVKRRKGRRNLANFDNPCLRTECGAAPMSLLRYRTQRDRRR